MLAQIANFVQNSLPSQVTIGAIVCEMVLRLVKSPQPLSIAHGFAAGLTQIAIISKGVADFLDKVLPQNTTPKV